MGKHRNKNSRTSHFKKRAKKYIEGNYENKRNGAKPAEDYTGNPLDIGDKIDSAGPISMDFNYRSKYIQTVFQEISDNTVLEDDPDTIEIESIAEDIVENMIKEDEGEDIVEDTENNEEIKQAKDAKGVYDMVVSQRVKRGMVFWYSLNNGVDKNSSPTIELEGKKYIDSLEYGNRPWLVVSCDEINRKNRLCTVVPLSSSLSNYDDNSPNKVHIYFMGRNTTILCEQIRTINSIELQEYANTLSDEVMDMVDKGIRYSLGVKESIEDIMSSSSVSEALNQIDSVIEKVIKSRIQKELEEINKNRLSTIDDMILKVSDGFEGLYKSAIEGTRDDLKKREDSKNDSHEVKEVKNDKVTAVVSGHVEESKAEKEIKRLVEEDKPFTSYSSRVSKFYERYPDLATETKNKGEEESREAKEVKSEKKETKKRRGGRVSTADDIFSGVIFLPSYKPVEVPKKEGKMRKWNDALLAQFAYDYSRMLRDDVMDKWDIESEKKLIDTARKVEKKLFTGNWSSGFDRNMRITFPGKVFSNVR